MFQDAIFGNKETINYVRPYVERAMQTYDGIVRVPVENEKQKFIRKRMEAAFGILERIIHTDIEEAIEREMNLRQNCAERRKQNLMMAGRALETIRAMNGNISESYFSAFSTERAIYRTPYGMVMDGVKEILEKFWTGE
jgi:hypothetical protein